MDLELEIRKITEAYCIENNIQIKRLFTHEELETAIQRVRDAHQIIAAEAATEIGA